MIKEPQKTRELKTRDPLVQGMLFDAALKGSFLVYTFQFVLSLVIIVLSTIFGKTFFSLLSTLLTASVIVLILFALRMDLESIDSGLTGNVERAGEIDANRYTVVTWSVYVQLGSILFYILGLIGVLETSSGI